jgi:hypothetical protein
MLSQEEIEKINAEIEYLEQARASSTDGGIRKQIEAWIEERRRKLIADNNPT